MKYVALLRGINVGGNSLVRMADLKKVFETCGCTDVVTYINSGNVLFESVGKDPDALPGMLEKALTHAFSFEIRLVVLTQEQLKAVAAAIPIEWKTEHDLRRYVAFVRKPLTPSDVISAVTPKKDVDFVNTGPQVVYLSTKLSGLTRSGFTRLVGSPVYKNMTMRNFTTVQKLLALIG